MAVITWFWMIVSVMVAADPVAETTKEPTPKSQTPPPLPDFSNLPMFLRSRNVSQSFRRLLYEELNVREFEVGLQRFYFCCWNVE